jgi:hypothetical protein
MHVSKSVILIFEKKKIFVLNDLRASDSTPNGKRLSDAKPKAGKHGQRS